jgi:hypothetical protein
MEKTSKSAEDVMRVVKTLLNHFGEDVVFSMVGVVTTEGIVMINLTSVLPGGVPNGIQDRLAGILRDAVGCPEGDLIHLTDIATKA